MSAKERCREREKRREKKWIVEFLEVAWTCSATLVCLCVFIHFLSYCWLVSKSTLNRWGKKKKQYVKTRNNYLWWFFLSNRYVTQQRQKKKKRIQEVVENKKQKQANYQRHIEFAVRRSFLAVSLTQSFSGRTEMRKRNLAAFRSYYSGTAYLDSLGIVCRQSK